MKTLLSMSLEQIYLEYMNNFITIKGMADHYGVEEKFMSKLYELARQLVTLVNS